MGRVENVLALEFSVYRRYMHCLLDNWIYVRGMASGLAVIFADSHMV